MNIIPEKLQRTVKTDLPGNAFHHHPCHRSDGAPLRVIERALWMIQTGQGTDLFLGHSGLVGRLEEGHRKTKKKQSCGSLGFQK